MTKPGEILWIDEVVMEGLIEKKKIKCTQQRRMRPEDFKTCRPYVCIDVNKDVITCVSLSTKNGFYRKEIPVDWRTGSDLAWLTLKEYVNPNMLFIGKSKVFRSARKSKHFGMLTSEGIEEIRKWARIHEHPELASP